MIQSILTYFKSAPSETLVAWVWFFLLICNIVSNILNRFKSQKLEKEISNLQQQIIRINNSNKNSLENVQNKYIGFTTEQVIQIYKELRENDKELNEKFLLQRDFRKMNRVLAKIMDNYSERFDILFQYIESVEKQGNILFEHMQKQDEYITNIPIIEIPDDWIQEN